MSKSKITDSTGYDFNINISQVGVKNAGIKPGEITIEEIAIFDSFKNYTTWATNAEKRIYNNVIYFHYPWEMIVKRVCYLKSQSRAVIKRRISKLCSLGLLKAHPKNKMFGAPFYAFGEKYAHFVNAKPVSKMRQVQQHPSQKRDSTRLKNETAPVSKMRQHPSQKRDSSIYSSNRTSNRTCIFLEKNFSTFKILKPNWTKWKKYLLKVHNEQLSQEREQDQFQHLINCGEEDPKIMAQIITQAKQGKFKMFIPLQGRKNKIRQNDFPDKWDPVFFKKLDPSEFPKYYKHLREKGFEPVRHNGQIIKWAIPQKQTV